MIDLETLWYYLEPFAIMVVFGFFAMLLGVIKNLWHLGKLPEDQNGWHYILQKASKYFQLGFTQCFVTWCGLGLWGAIEFVSAEVLVPIAFLLCAEILPAELWERLWQFLKPLWEYFSEEKRAERREKKKERLLKRLEALKKLKEEERLAKEKEMNDIENEIKKISEQ